MAIIKYFSRSLENETKRWGMMLFANYLFKVYFKMSLLRLIKPLIRALQSSPLKNKFSIGQQVTYKYYAGLKAMIDEDYKTGTQDIQFRDIDSGLFHLQLHAHKICIFWFLFIAN